MSKFGVPIVNLVDVNSDVGKSQLPHPIEGGACKSSS